MSVAGIAPLRTADVRAESTFIEPQTIFELPQESSVTNSTDTQATLQNNAATTDVTINGQPVPVPNEGVSSSTIEHADGQTKVDISVQSNTSGSSQTESSTHFQFNSSTSVTTESESSTEEKTR